jgi:hypothetical protein
MTRGPSKHLQIIRQPGRAWDRFASIVATPVRETGHRIKTAPLTGNTAGLFLR